MEQRQYNSLYIRCWIQGTVVAGSRRFQSWETNPCYSFAVEKLRHSQQITMIMAVPQSVSYLAQNNTKTISYINIELKRTSTYSKPQ